MTTMPVAPTRASALTDALVAPPDLEVDAEELSALRRSLVRDLSSLVVDLAPGEELVLDAHRLMAARTDPERCTVDAPFRPSPRLVRRAVGLAAVSRLVRGRSPAPAAAVADVLRDALEEQAERATASPGAPRPAWWGEWYAGLAPGARAVVEAEAVGWATHLCTAVEWARLRPTPVVGGRDDWWDCPGARRLTLRGRVDVRVPLGARQALLVVVGGVPAPDWRVVLGFPALVATLVRGERSMPVRVVGTWPACGHSRVLQVDVPALRVAADAVVAAAGTWVDALIEARRPGERSQLRSS